MSMTLATTWVRRGVAAQFPTKYEVNEAELNRISKLARLQLEDAQEDLENAQNPKKSDHDDDESADSDSDTGVPTGAGETQSSSKPAAEDEMDDLKEYNLDDYDNEEVDEKGEKFAMFGNVGSLAYHAPHEKDPYLVLPEGEQDSDDEREELQILPSDNLILAAKVEDEVAHLEVFVYEDEADNLYVHHDIMLPAVPLCVEWINFPVGDNSGRTEGNFVAVGTMSPEIEVWDLDVVDSMYPNAILGQEPAAEDQDESKKKSKKKKKKSKANDEYHVDAVLALAANRHHRNLLASASADKTVKLWDLNTGKCAKSYNMHSGKVCALDWHPTETTVLLSGSYDRNVVATDMRAPDAVAPRWIVEADVEKVKWDVHDPNFFYVTTEGGTVHYFDARVVPTSHDTPSKPVWTLQAHDGAVSAFDINPTVPGLLATGSDDKKVKLWNVEDNKPSMVVSRNLDVGRVFSVQFAPDPEVAFRLAVAGSKGQLQVWDISTNPSVRNVFAGKVKLPESTGKERLVGIKDDGDDESDDDEEDEAGGEGGVQTAASGQDWESMDED
ncbi:rRNA-processing protein [Exophiala dermatitidis]|uniref:rRNA-processing protein n=1 Tax=Exophiala dermatitidis TaxID=5970 RepID=A0AAN6IXB4_EXODE|nr:rRNA-processing protein [Exophiala dermatitidis]KAJ4526244.1 rRNA-processing protein [Exophiala dermatitidis]KAJ4526814.1 rRNA-processing protein [Exophiala dermatitidis]KAJ4532522.1 rRNA-processing protein [Exophiala dermatitidis]KAJ4546968.1 rRNA-processing protein [Exophiala dermatitidis]